MNFKSAIILYVLQKFNEERTVYGIYHLLKGKKTSQTIFDAKLYNCEQLFATMQQLTRDEFQQSLLTLKNKGFIKINGEGLYSLSPNIAAELSKFFEKQPIPRHVQGYKYSTVASTFWERFSLYSQTLSNVINNQKFIPIIPNEKAVDWVKKNFPNKHSRVDVSQKLYKECQSILSKVSSLEAEIFMLRLSHAERIGLTIEQIAQELSMDETEVSFYYLSTLHFFVATILNYRNDYEQLATFISKNENDFFLTQTASATYKLMQQGYHANEIINIRQLKQSTIEDHIVEIASNIENFSIDDYVSTKQQEEVINAIRKVKSKRLKEVKETLLNDEINYFQIRLVLAKGGF
jgi:uncharacterized protein YpbB